MKTMTTRTMNRNKQNLSPERRQQLLRVLNARFETNMNRHESLEWAQVQAKLKGSAEKLWSLNQMERTGGERTLSGTIQGRTNTSFTIVQRKVRMAEGTSATIVKRWRQEKNTNREIALPVWQLLWVSSS